MDSEICEICKRQTKKYVCPTCNIPYCSLTCFRAPGHAQCSEPFYKKELESDILGDTAKKEDEKRRMMELLQRFEESSPSSDHDDEDEDEDNILDRFQNMDIQDMDSDALWDLLSSEEQADFMRKLQADELTSLAVETPWWEKPQTGIEDVDEERPGRNKNLQIRYNLIYILMSYMYLIRLFGVSSFADEEDNTEARLEASKLLPFLSSNSSKVLYASLDEVVVSFSSSASNASVAAILKDLEVILRPTITGMRNCLKALEDLRSSLLTKETSRKKIMFYLISVRTWDFDISKSIHTQVSSYRRNMEDKAS